MPPKKKNKLPESEKESVISQDNGRVTDQLRQGTYMTDKSTSGGNKSESDLCCSRRDG